MNDARLAISACEEMLLETKKVALLGPAILAIH